MNGRQWIALLLALMLAAAAASGCASTAVRAGGPAGPDEPAADATLVIGAYSVIKDAFDELLPMFREQWLAETGQRLTFQESYEASGTQARSIIGGFEADVAVLAMETEIDKIKQAGFITHDWRADEDGGMITRSIVVIGTREGNPLGIRDWDDLARDGVKVLYPNPRTSGGAQWDINAIFGAGLKRAEEQGLGRDTGRAARFLADIHANVESMDKSGRASMAAFEYGVGDAIVTYENELLARIAQGAPHHIVMPRHTILIENPAAVIDVNADKHGVREAAEAFVRFLRSPEAQRVLARHGFRPVEPGVQKETADRFPVPEGLFDIEYLGGWDHVREELYGKRGIWYQVLAGGIK